LVVYLSDHLQPLLQPRYIAALEERAFVQAPRQGDIIPHIWRRRNRPERVSQATAMLDADAPVEVQLPGLEIHESYIKILDRQSGQRVVTVIEVVSPTNKFRNRSCPPVRSFRRWLADLV
jgi:hypothetical protein